MQIVPAQLPGIPGVSAADLLKKYKLQAGDSADFVPADGPFSFKAADKLQLKVTRSDVENAPVTTLQIPLTLGSAPTTPAGSGYRIPPLTLPGAVHLIHGPLSGDTRKTQITVNGTTVKILAESPREVFCFVPPTTQIGPAEWILEDSGRRVHLKIWVLALQMSPDKLKLMKGESTAFHVYIKGVETIPQEAWFAAVEKQSGR